MSDKKLGELIVTDFIDSNVDYLEKVVKQLETEPMSFNRKTRELQKILEKGIAYGIAKGGFIEECRKGKVVAAKKARYERWCTELFYKINEDIEANMKRIKYKKKKS